MTTAKKQKPGSKQSSPILDKSSGVRGWGGNVKAARFQSGIKLKLDNDQDCILRFLGTKDISQFTGSPDPQYYLVFFDGKTVVSMSQGYALAEANFEPGNFYYLHNAGEVELPGRNPMKDYEIIDIGQGGNPVECPERIHESGKFTPSDKNIAECNYERLNYPLRKG